MFTNLISKASPLDKAIVLSVAVMLSFNVLVLASQVEHAPTVAQAQGAAAQQA